MHSHQGTLDTCAFFGTTPHSPSACTAYPQVLYLAAALTVALAILMGALLPTTTAQAQDPALPTPTPVPSNDAPDVVPGTPGPEPRTIPTMTIYRSLATVTEGDYIYYPVFANPAPTSRLRVYFDITETGDYLIDPIPDYIDMDAGDTSLWLILTTDDDSVDEPNGSVLAEIEASPTNAYTLGSSYHSTVSVNDNDDPVVTTPLPPTSLNLVIEPNDNNDLDLTYTRTEFPRYTR